MRKYAAQSLLKLLLFKHLPLPPMLTECIQENENKLVELNLKRRLSSDSKTIEEKDILIFFF